MAIPSRQIGWGTESNLLWQILKQLNKLTSVLFGLKEAATPNYKVFTAIVTAWDTDPPVVIELENTIGTITISRIGDGRYHIESASLFTEYKTVLFYGSISRQSEYATDPQLISTWANTSRIRLDTLIGSTESNFVIWETPIEIRVYN